MSETPKEPVDIYMVAAMMAEQFAEIAWQKLGLQPDVLTGTIHKDLAQAKVAIDLASYVAGVVEPQLDDDDRRQMQNLVANLRLNYVQKMKEEQDSPSANV